MFGTFAEDVIRVPSGQLVLVFSRGPTALMRADVVQPPLLLRLVSPPGGTFGVHVWAAQDDERGWDGIERSMQRVYGDNLRSEVMDSRSIELAGAERDVVCHVREFSM